MQIKLNSVALIIICFIFFCISTLGIIRAIDNNWEDTSILDGSFGGDDSGPRGESYEGFSGPNGEESYGASSSSGEESYGASSSSGEESYGASSSSG
jgi:hypothetical protein